MASSSLMMQYSMGSVAATTTDIIRLQDWVPAILSKRKASWGYLTRIFEGGRVFYNTALVTEQDIRQIWTEERLQKRTQRFFTLGTALGGILDIPSAHDFARAISHITLDYESLIAADVKSKSPFNIDYLITLASLCDAIFQVYDKLLTHHKKDQVWQATTLDSFQKADTRFKKVMVTIYKDLEALARDIMTDELNSVDPLGGLFSHSATQDDDSESQY
ncbi:hypothetical protein BGX21_008457 [Mortierella sp. AD011]|nr:hypothetical protein BGX20_005011 [Mortierella sp. AD010]KAF9402837.1 hypothetical protein BGX21_008457 [Mortierella sp. AD011]